MHIDKFNSIVDKYVNKYLKTKKIKPFDVKSDTYIDFNVESNDNDLKCKVGDHGGMSKYKNIFAKDCTPNW